MATETESETAGLESRGVGSQSALSKFVNDHITAVMLLPALLTILAIFIYPVVFLFWQSVHVTVPGLADRFVAIQNYVNLFQEPQFYNYFKTTLAYSFGSLFLSLTSGLMIALAINHMERTWMRNIYSTLILFAWAVPLAVIAIIFKFIFQGGQFGLLNMILVDLGILATSHAWLSDQSIILYMVMSVDAWARMPFAMIVFLAGLQSIPEHMYDAAKVDGATTFQTFRNITIPFLRPYFAIVALINWMFAFRAFAVIFPMTQGGPGSATTTLSIWIYQVGMVQIRPGFGSAIAAFLVFTTVIVATFYVTVVLQRVEDD